MRKILSIFAAMLVAFAVNAQTDFSAPYSCAADDGVISGDAPANKVFLQSDTDPHYIGWSDVSKSYTAVVSWTVTATRACYVNVTLDLGPVISSNKHIFEVKILDAEKKELGAVEEGPAYTGDGFTEANQEKVLSGKIMLPAAGTYTIELRNNRDFCKGTIKNVILTYAGDAPVTDFSAPYSCAADDALISGDAPANKVFLQSDTDPHYIGWSDVSKSYTAEVSWSFIATRGCMVNVTLDLGPTISSNKHIFDVELYNDKGVRIDTIAEGPNYTGDGFTEANQTKSLGEIVIPAAGSYTLKLMNKRDFCKGTIKNVILTYAADVPKFYLKGNWNDENPDHFTTKEMVCVARNKYILENVVFGTKGVNWGDDPSWSYGHWETVDEFLGTKPTRLDTVTLALDLSTGDITCTILGKYPKMVAKGFDDWSITRAFEIAADEKSASLALNLDEIKKYEFKLMLEGQWRSNAKEFKRSDAKAEAVIENYDNMKIDVDKAGEYILTWTFDDNALTIAYPSDPVAKLFEIDLRKGQLGTSGTNLKSWLAINGTDTAFTDVAPAEYNAVFEAKQFNGSQHGYELLKATVPVLAGSYKVTLGKCQYAYSADYTMAYVKSEDGAQELASVKQNTSQNAGEEGVCYHQDPAANVATMEFTVDADQIVNILCAHYTPYIKIEEVVKYDVTPNGSIENGSISVDKSKAAEGETVTITINPASEYELDWLKVNGSETGITIAADKLSATFTMPAEAVTVDAAFKKVIVYYNVTIAATTNGTVEADKATAAEGEEVKLTITPDENYALDELEVIGNVTSNAVTVTDGAFKMPAEAVTVSATFKYNKFAVEIASGIQHGSVSANKAEAVAGEEVKLTYTPEEYWELDEVEVIGKETSKAVTVTDGAFKMPAEAVTVNATFKAIPQNWTVTQAYDFIEGLAVGGKKEGKFTVTGFVTKVDYKYSESSKNMTIWIADANSEKEVQLFKATPEDEASQKINIGDKVTSTADSLIKFKKNEETPIARELARPSVKLIEAAASRSCADVYKMADGMEVNLNDVVVTYVNGKNVWVRDASASLLIYMPANATYKAGDILSSVVAELDIYNKVYELKPTAAQVSAITVTAGSAPAPIEIASIAIEDMNKYVIVKGLEVVGEFKNNAQTNIDVKIGGETIVLRNQFKIAYTFEAGKKYDITAVVTIYNNKQQLYFVSAAESSATGIENVGMTEKAVKVMENGQIYIIKNGIRYSITGSEIR